MDIQNAVGGAAATTALVMMLINAVVQNWPEDRPKTLTAFLDTVWQWTRKSAMSYMSTRMGTPPVIPPTNQTTTTRTDTHVEAVTIVPDPKALPEIPKQKS